MVTLSDSDDSISSGGGGGDTASEADAVDDDSVPGSLQVFCDDQGNWNDTGDRIPFVIGIKCSFDNSMELLANEPYSNKMFAKEKKTFKPMTAHLRMEIARRLGSGGDLENDEEAKKAGKPFKSKNKEWLLSFLHDHPLSNKNRAWVERTELKFRNLLQNKIQQDSDLSATRAHISGDDRLRLIEALFDDDARSLLASTQEVLSREQLDARNSVVMNETDYFQKVADLANSPDFVANILPMPELHPDFAEAQSVEPTSYQFTRAKVKEVYNDMRVKLYPIVENYEKSGNGIGQRGRGEDHKDWGTVDLSLATTIDGDDRSNFLPHNNPHASYLLLFWHRLQECGLVQFTLAKLPDKMRASSDELSMISSTSRPTNRQAALADPISQVAKNLGAFTRAASIKQISEWKEKVFDIGCRLHESELDESMEAMLKKRKMELELDIEKEEQIIEDLQNNSAK